MQVFNASPRTAFTVAQIRDLLTGDSIEYSSGLEILDSSNNVIEDISDYLVSGSVERTNSALIHGTCKLRIERELAWGKDRIRPFMTVSNGSITARFNLGVFVMTTPEENRGEDPISYDVTGFDLLYLLQSSLSDTYVVASGTTYLTAVQDLITASGIGATVNLDGTLQSATLPTTMVWALSPNLEDRVSWLSIINDLLATINYQKLWADENGVLQSSPYIAPIDRAIEWTFDTSDDATNIIGSNRKATFDVWASKNWWRFVRKGMTVEPTEGAGIYTVENISTGRTSQTALGRVVKAQTLFLDAADQTSLVAQGDRIVAANQAISRSFEINVDALPVAGHWDIVEFTDADATDKCRVISWSVPLDGSQGKWTLESVEA